jgi:hypothetical protein
VRIFTPLIFSFFMGLFLPASSFSAAAEDYILTLRNSATAIETYLTYQDIEALEQVSFETSTHWNDGIMTYTGPSLASVLALTGPYDKSAHIKVTAANDYSHIATPDLISKTYPILANKINGEPFSLREKGPLWVMYPFDKHAKFKTESHFSASVWQVVEIEILPK